MRLTLDYTGNKTLETQRNGGDRGIEYGASAKSRQS
jgi:hypothetical protein